MFNANSGYSLADIAAATGCNGNSRNSDMWGDNGAWWIILLFFFAWGGFGGNGWGSFGGRNQSALTIGELDISNLDLSNLILFIISFIFNRPMIYYSLSSYRSSY